MILFLTYFVIVVMIFLIICTSFVAVVRRVYMDSWYRRLDACRDKYVYLSMALADGRPVGDSAGYSHKPKSVEWLAVEDTLFNALDNPACDRERVVKCFDDFGYTDWYINSVSEGGRWDQPHSAEKLGLIRCARAVPVLVKALDSQHRDTKIMAVYALGEIKDESAIKSLIEKLRAAVQEDADVSLRIIKSSLAYYGEAAFDRLAAELKDPSWQVREAIVDVLGEIKGPRVEDVFFDALGDPEQEIRAKAAKGLGKLKCRRAVGPLMDLLNDQFWMVRLNAAKALGAIGDQSAIEPVEGLLKDGNWQIRRAAAEALGMLGGRAFLVLVNTYLFSGDKYAVEQSSDELERNGIFTAVLQRIIDQLPVSGEWRIPFVRTYARDVSFQTITPEIFHGIAGLLVRAGREKVRKIYEQALHDEKEKMDIDRVIEAIWDMGAA